MTVQVSTAKVSRAGNGAATSFSFGPLTIFQPDPSGDGTHDLEVTKVAADGTETTVLEGAGAANFTVVMTAGYPGTGSITYPSTGATRLATGESLIIKRKLDLLQLVDLENQGGYFPDTLEQGIDRPIMIAIQQQEELDRAIKVPIGSTQTSSELLQSVYDASASASASASAAQTSEDNSSTSETNAAASAAAAAASAASIALPLPVASGGTGATTPAAARANLGVETGSATVTAGEALSSRNLVYQDVFNQRGGGADRWYQVDTDATAPVRISPRVGIALAAISSGASGLVQLRPGRVSGFAGLTVGQPVFASATAGAITQTAPAIPSTGTQNAARLIGYAASATEIDFDPGDDTIFTARSSALAVDGTVTVQHWTDAGARDRHQSAYVVQAASTTTTGTFAAGNIGTRIIDNANGQSLGFQFVATATGTLTSARTSVSSVTTAGSWEGRLYTNNAGSPGTQVGSSSNAQTISASGDVTLTFGTPPSLTSGTTYWFVLTPTSGSPSITLNTAANQAGYGSGRNNTITAITDSGFGASEEARVEINQAGAARDEPLTIGGSIANAAATDRVNVRYDDGSGANADTRTTFINRTGATRDLAVEVVL